MVFHYFVFYLVVIKIYSTSEFQWTHDRREYIELHLKWLERLENTNINGKMVWNLKINAKQSCLFSYWQKKKHFHNRMQLNANTFANIFTKKKPKQLKKSIIENNVKYFNLVDDEKFKVFHLNMMHLYPWYDIRQSRLYFSREISKFWSIIGKIKLNAYIHCENCIST